MQASIFIEIGSTMRGITLDRNNHYVPLPQGLSDDEEEPTASDNSTQDANHSISLVSPPNIPPPPSPIRIRSVSGMSWERTVCFILSLFLAGFVVSAFLWLVPCDTDFAPCQVRESFRATPDWKITLPSTAFSSGLQLVDADQDGRTDIIFGFRPMPGSNDSTLLQASSSPYTAGVMVLRGYDGQKLWCQTYYTAPNNILCNLLDVNQDGVKECIIVGDQSLFSAINISNDYTFWYLHDHSDPENSKNQRPTSISLPAVVSDLNADGVYELIATCQLSEDVQESSNARYIILVSGKMGEILGRPFPLPGCTEASQPLVYSVNGTISVIVQCENEQEEGVILKVDLMALYRSLSNHSLANNVSSIESDVRVDNLFQELHRYSGQGSQLHLLTTDVNNDNIQDIIAAGGDGEVALLHGPELGVAWISQKSKSDIISCTVGPLLPGGTACILVTYLEHNCNKDCRTTVVAISGRDGTELWTYPSNFLALPVAATIPEARRSFALFKLLSRLSETEESYQIQDFESNAENYYSQKTDTNMNDDETEQLTTSTEVPRSTSSDVYLQKKSIDGHAEETDVDQNESTISVQELLVLLDASGQSQQLVLSPNLTVCYTPEQSTPECLSSTLHTQAALGDLDGDGSLDIVSISLNVIDDNQGVRTQQITVSKINLAGKIAWSPGHQNPYRKNPWIHLD